MDAAPLGDDELVDWLRLTGTPGLGAVGCRKLLSTFGLPSEVLAAGREALARVVSAPVADALRAPPSDALAESIEKTHRWVVEPGNAIVTLADRRYPKALLETTDPPTLLYVKGRVSLLGAPTLAIVGSRNATPQGMIDARRFATALAEQGYTIASGLALGIDAAAHEGALAAGDAGGSTIAVVGTGIDIVYPAAHRALAHRIADAGLLVSELPLGTTATAHQFPRRNRIIAGLARGVLVIEAAARSGSLITARLASEAGREVFAVPGSIHSPLSKGGHQLIRQGAKLVESVADIVDEIGVPDAEAASRSTVSAVATSKSPASPSATDDPEPVDATDDRVLSAVGFDPVLADEVADRCALDASTVSMRLLSLELAGRIVRLPGGRVQRLAG